MQKTITFIALFFSYTGVFSQVPFSTHIQNIQGIWIAKNFKESFDSTGSMIASSYSFDGFESLQKELDKVAFTLEKNEP